MYVHRIFLGGMLAVGLAATSAPASAIGLFGPSGPGPWLEEPAYPDPGLHREGRRHHHGRHGWHLHRDWRYHGHAKPRRHGHRWHDDWEDGAGIALGLLAGMLLLNGITDDAGASHSPGLAGAYPRTLDAHSQRRQGQAIRSALEAGGGGVFTWANPANRGGGASGEVRVTRSGRDGHGNACREYHQSVWIGSRNEQGHRVACRDRNGQWRLQP